MKVLFVPSDNNPASGAFLSMTALNKLLNEKLDVETFVVLPHKGGGTKLLQENGIRHKVIRSFSWTVPCDGKSGPKYLAEKCIKKFVNAFAVGRIARLAKKEKVDLIHINTTYTYVGALAAKRAGLPLVWHLREFLEEDQGRTLWDREKGNRLINEADRVIVISGSMREKYRDIITGGKLVTILNGIDTDRFYAPDKTIFNTGKVTLIYGGGYAREKGVYELADALRIVVEKGLTDFEILYIGEPTGEYKKYVEEAGLTPYVKYCGYQKHVEDFYAVADIGINSSQAEAFGRKTVEAMLCGTLMIAANTGGTLDIIRDKETGLLYRQGSAEDLAEKLLFAMENREKCREMAARGRDFACRELNADRNARDIKNVYEEILNKK